MPTLTGDAQGDQLSGPAEARRPPRRRAATPTAAPDADATKPEAAPEERPASKPRSAKARARKPEPAPKAKPAPKAEPAASPEPAATRKATAKPKPQPQPGAEPRPKTAPKSKAGPKPKPARATTPPPEAAAQPKEEQPRSGGKRIWISGASGFVGLAVARLLRMRGDEVVAPVRDRRRAQELIDTGATVIEDDLSEVDMVAEQLRDMDAVIHAAGSYRVGIARAERGAMWDANIGTTTRVLDAAEAARVPRVVYVSTVGVFGNTRGQVVDETYRRNIREGFLSWYDETKFGAHEVAAQRARTGAPIVNVLPSQVYGPGDHSAIGAQLAQAHAGKLPYRALADVGVGWVHVDDLAVGIVAALDRGAAPGTYVLSGPRHRLADALEIAARLGGKRLPRMTIPNGFLRALAPVGRLIGQPSLREVVDASAGVTYWASSDKAARELGFAPRSLEDGLRDTFEAMADRAYTRA